MTKGANNRGNFLEFVHLLAKYVAVLREHLVKVQIGWEISTFSLWPHAQIELVSNLVKRLRKKIINEFKARKHV